MHRCLDCLPTALTHWVVRNIFQSRELLIYPSEFGDMLRQSDLKHVAEDLCNLFDTIPPHEVKILARYYVFPVEETVHCQSHAACDLCACYLHSHLFEGEVVFGVFFCFVPSNEGAFGEVVSSVVETLLKRARSPTFPLNCVSLHPFKDRIHEVLLHKLF